MKFSDFYNNAEGSLKNSYISLHAGKNTVYAEHLRSVLENEKLVKEPVFQSVFPWQTCGRHFDQFSDLLGQDFVSALGNAHYTDPDDATVDEDWSITPNRDIYRHQEQSWIAAQDRSILVTTGTGSGKTECFMIPVLKDLYEAKRINPNVGIGAIFLYPLNALMSSQRKRIYSWCKALNPKVTFGIYNSNMIGRANNDRKRQFFPEIIDRETLRSTPPQILLTNPTMIEYMMVRGADVNLANNSDLKWIVLDEAHTYTGSAATELAMQIRRILQFFGKTPADVKFAITSATISNDPQKGIQMKDFFSKLTGKDFDRDFVKITGDRIVPDLEPNDLNQKVQSLNRRINGLNISPSDIINLRRLLDNQLDETLSVNQIADALRFQGNLNEKLNLIDAISTLGSAKLASDNSDTAMLPVRAHFFARSFSGMYSCFNPNCNRYRAYHIGIGSLVSHMSPTCPDCGSHMLEVIKCAQCGEWLLHGDWKQLTDNRMVYSINNAFEGRSPLVDFVDENSGDDDDGGSSLQESNPLYLTTAREGLPFDRATMMRYYLNPIEGSLSLGVRRDANDVEFVACLQDGDNNAFFCPCCGAPIENSFRINLSAEYASRRLTHSLLEQSPENNRCARTLYKGQKYLTFSDNRRASASLAKSINVDVEREWTRALVYKYLVDNIRENDAHNNPQLTELDSNIRLMRSLVDQHPELQANLDDLEQQRTRLLQNLQTNTLIYPSVTLNQLVNDKCNDRELRQLFDRIGKDRREKYVRKNNLRQVPQEASVSDYLRALLFDQLSKSSLRGNSLETMGLVQLEYPVIDNLTNSPDVFREYYGLDAPRGLREWKNLLYILVDWKIRRQEHVVMSDMTRSLMSQYFHDTPIFCSAIEQPRQEQPKVKKWPKIFIGERRNIGFVRDRIIMLMLFGKGIVSQRNITFDDATTINEILDIAWRTIVPMLTQDNVFGLSTENVPNIGYKLDIFDGEKVRIGFVRNANLCPVSHQFVNHTFMGFSPSISCKFSENTSRMYALQGNDIEIPILTIRQQSDQYLMADGRYNKETWRSDVETWSNDAYVNSLNRQNPSLTRVALIPQINIIKDRDIYLSSEHSAQVRGQVLRRSEKAFEDGEVNILSCSTTMEMGVDIGDLSIVSMNNVPPKPANYLQRAGRAGRRKETQCMSLTILSDDPIGSEVENDPKWALDHEIEAPYMNFSSNIIMQRNVNSLLFGRYVRSVGGGNITDEIGAFLKGHGYGRPFALIRYTYQGFRDYLHNLLNNHDQQYGDVVDKLEILLRGTCLDFNNNEQEVAVDNLIHSTLDGLTVVCDAIERQIDSLEAVINYDPNAEHEDDEQQAPQPSYMRKCSFQLENLWKKNITGVLASYNFLPNANMPINLGELLIDSSEYEKADNPTRPLYQAISEYAPGNEIVVSEYVYPVEGIKIGREGLKDAAENSRIQVCQNCHAFYVTPYGGRNITRCSQCGAQLGSILANAGGTIFTDGVQPHAFIPGKEKLYRKPLRTAYKITEPALMNMPAWSPNVNSAYSIRCSNGNQGEVLVANLGYGHGFALCPYCGKMEPELAPYPALVTMAEHSNIERDGRCYGNETGARHHVALYASNKTDIAEIQLNLTSFETNCNLTLSEEEKETLAYSLGTVIGQQFAKILGISEDEIEFGITAQKNIFIYDTNSGGANYSSQLPEFIQTVLDASRSKLGGCNCERCCTNCLVDRKSLWNMSKLDRNLALLWLNFEQRQRDVVPQDLKNRFAGFSIHKVTGNIDSELRSVLYRPYNRDFHFFLYPGLHDEIYASLSLDMQRLTLSGKSFHLAVSRTDTTPTYFTAKRLSRFFFPLETYNYNVLPNTVSPILLVPSRVEIGRSELYVKNISDSCYYKITYPTDRFNFNDYIVPEILRDMTIVNRHTQGNTSSEGYLGMMLGDSRGDMDIFMRNRQNRNVKVEIQDIYISSPLYCNIMTMVMNQLERRYHLTINSYLLKVANVFEKTGDFNDAQERFDYLAECMDSLNLPELEENVNIKTERLDHDRYFHVFNDEFCIELDADAGLANGWMPMIGWRTTITPGESVDLRMKPGVNTIKYTISWKETRDEDQIDYDTRTL